MLDEIDRAVIHALHLDGRVPFSRIAHVLGVSTQTVARRYNRLRAEGALRVVGLVDVDRVGGGQWLIRLVTEPRVTQQFGYALARRTDTTYVCLTSTGGEIVALTRTAAGTGPGHPPLLRDTSLTSRVTGVIAYRLLHTYLGGVTGWQGSRRALDERQCRELVADDAAVRGPHGVVDPTACEDNMALLQALQRDGRTSQRRLGASTGWSCATIARRLADLRAGGYLYFDVEVDRALFGVTTTALLWMSVSPAQLHQVATALAGHDDMALVATTTGPTNLVAHALCTSADHLHHYLTHQLAKLDGILTLETTLVLRNLMGGSPQPALDPPAARLPLTSAGVYQIRGNQHASKRQHAGAA
ncbi:MAG TPA: AsnC family transcriptional regulator [Rugosimonospora sp.]|nr:AsnC family transcriptional regulator [Rugosimonospora sp.]